MVQIPVVDGVVEHVRRRKEMYLGREDIVPENLATALVGDALTLGVKKVEVIHVDDWWLVCSEQDWLAMGNTLTINETFNRLVPLEGGGLEAMRREILLTAFASAVFTRKDNELVQIVGAAPLNIINLNKVLENIPDNYRVVGFNVSRPDNK